MNKSMTCPFCNAVFPITTSTLSTYSLSFRSNNPKGYAQSQGKDFKTWDVTKDAIDVEFALCPKCDKHSIKVIGMGIDVNELKVNLVPSSSATQFPEYVPQQIRQDYEEACMILNLSPKASATLSRRCLQGMIRDFWGISNKGTLHNEIEAIKDKIDPRVRKVLDSVRQLGNIGAHMEKDINLIIDIDLHEAERLIKLIEFLIKQWYINRHNTDELLNSIIEINEDKQTARKS